MIRIGLIDEVTEVPTPEGSSVRLLARTWWFSVAYRGRGLSIGYHRPRRVEWRHESIPVVDHLGIARLVALTTLLLSLMIRRRSK